MPWTLSSFAPRRQGTTVNALVVVPLGTRVSNKQQGDGGARRLPRFRLQPDRATLNPRPLPRNSEKAFLTQGSFGGLQRRECSTPPRR